MTELIYLNDTYLNQLEAKVIEVKNTEKGVAIILDKTIFYPQGGGQPSDQGKIYSEKGIFVVTDVRVDENGMVYHFGNFENGNFQSEDTVKLEIDGNRRILNSRLHSAGHLIDIAAKRAGLGLKAIKGYHFPDGPYVEYMGTVENPENYIFAVEEAANILVTQDLKIFKKEISSEEAKIRGFYAPAGKAARAVNFEGNEEVGCGGTHVNSSKEIGKIVIRKISSKKGNTKIAYSL